MAFGLGLLAVLWGYGPHYGPTPVEAHRGYGLGQLSFARWLASDATALAVLYVLLTLVLILFTLGLFARLAFVIASLGFTLHVMVVLTQRGAHDWGLPLVTLWALAPVRWSDGLSLDALRRSRPAQPCPYGYAIWLPPFTVGLALLAATYAKLDRSGIAWVTDGAARYYILLDGSIHSPIPELAVWLAQYRVVGVVLSALTVLIEGTAILVVLFGNWRLRLAFGALLGALFFGLYLGQGIQWAPWWLLLLAYLPWQQIRPPEKDLHQVLRPMYVGVVAVLAGVQFYASTIRAELEPLYSNFPMYSSSYPSMAAYFTSEPTVVPKVAKALGCGPEDVWRRFAAD